MRLRATALLTTSLTTAGLVLALAGTASAADLDCDDYPNQAAAQAALDADPSDPNDLDADDDGQACESYAYASNGTQVTTRPQGAVAAGDGSSAEGPGALPYAVGGLALVGAAGAAVAARRSARTPA